MLTIVTVVRNGVGTLAATLASVLAQAGDDIEYIVVDGASTDGTLRMLEDHRERLSMVVSEPDRGIYDAMNKALALARGQWLLFLGADDILCGNVRRWMAAFKNPDTVYYGNVMLAQQGVRSGGRFSTYRLMQENICHQAIAYPRSIYKSKTYDLEVGLLADHKYNIELWGAGVPFRYVDHDVAIYNEGGASSKAQASFVDLKMRLIREHFGGIYYVVKLARNAAVKIFKGN